MNLRPPGIRKACREGKSRRTKENGRPWNEAEMALLREIVLPKVEAAGGSHENFNWSDIAKALPGRTGKQCREKWKNDLRPDITKAPWSPQEEYILALAHSKVGNKWADIARYLPRRAENTIKNHWYATMRAKAKEKTRTFLYTYGTMVESNRRPAVSSQEIFDKALDKYRNSEEDVDPPETFIVPEDYFQNQAMKRQSEASAPGSPGSNATAATLANSVDESCGRQITRPTISPRITGSPEPKAIQPCSADSLHHYRALPPLCNVGPSQPHMNHGLLALHQALDHHATGHASFFPRDAECEVKVSLKALPKGQMLAGKPSYKLCPPPALVGPPPVPGHSMSIFNDDIMLPDEDLERNWKESARTMAALDALDDVSLENLLDSLVHEESDNFDWDNMPNSPPRNLQPAHQGYPAYNHTPISSARSGHFKYQTYSYQPHPYPAYPMESEPVAYPQHPPMPYAYPPHHYMQPHAGSWQQVPAQAYYQHTSQDSMDDLDFSTSPTNHGAYW